MPGNASDRGSTQARFITCLLLALCLPGCIAPRTASYQGEVEVVANPSPRFRYFHGVFYQYREQTSWPEDAMPASSVPDSSVELSVALAFDYTDADAKYLVYVSRLRRIEFGPSGTLSEDAFTELMRNPGVKELKFFDDPWLTPTCLRAIKNSHVEHIAFFSLRAVTEKELAELEGSKHLKFILFVDCPHIDPYRVASQLKIETSWQ